jgi:hypothetical protein
LPIIGGSSGSRRGIATVDCPRERVRDDEAVIEGSEGVERDDDMRGAMKGATPEPAL